MTCPVKPLPGSTLQALIVHSLRIFGDILALTVQRLADSRPWPGAATFRLGAA